MEQTLYKKYYLSKNIKYSDLKSVYSKQNGDYSTTIPVNYITLCPPSENSTDQILKWTQLIGGMGQNLGVGTGCQLAHNMG
jgi:hypothetical protein